MRYVQINAYSDNWAESIIFKKHRELTAAGDESWVFWARGNHEEDDHMQKIASFPEVCFDVLQTRLDGKAAFHSKQITRRLLKKLDDINPDVVHLHVLLGYYINVEMLFDWLASHKCQVIWTLHDCWSFTGHCYYFTYAKCDQWKTGCDCSFPCPQLGEYPETIAKKSVRWNYENKRRLFTMLPSDRMRLIVPSQWLADLVSQSYMAKYPVDVVHNTINTNVFKPTSSSFRDSYGVGERFMILGVASKWSERKGLADFIRLASDCDPAHFSVVVIGLNDKQIKEMPKQMIALEKTDSLAELVEAYSAADVFFNPTVEDNYPTVNLEAEACGTPVITYDTGGCRETISLPNSSIVTGYDQSLQLIKTLCALK